MLVLKLKRSSHRMEAPVFLPISEEAREGGEGGVRVRPGAVPEPGDDQGREYAFLVWRVCLNKHGKENNR